MNVIITTTLELPEAEANAVFDAYKRGGATQQWLRRDGAIVGSIRIDTRGDDATMDAMTITEQPKATPEPKRKRWWHRKS